MYLAVDAVLVAVIALSAFIGYKKGFIDEILDLVSGIVAFFAAYFLTPLAAPYVNDHFLFDKISQKAADLINGLIAGSGGDVFGDGSANETFRSIVGKFGADYDVIKDRFTGMMSQQSAKAVSAISTHIAKPVSYALSYALCFIIIFIAALFILWLIKRLLDLAAKLPPLEKANKALGLIVGVLFGILFVWVISVVLKLGLPYLSVMAPSVFPEDLFEKSYVFRAAYYLNALRSMVNISYINKLLGT